MVAAGATAQQDAQAGLELTNELALSRDIAFANAARQLAAWNEIHTLYDPGTLFWNTRRGILPCPLEGHLYALGRAQPGQPDRQTLDSG